MDDIAGWYVDRNIDAENYRDIGGGVDSGVDVDVEI